jgi:hypothetical protein
LKQLKTIKILTVSTSFRMNDDNLGDYYRKRAHEYEKVYFQADSEFQTHWNLSFSPIQDETTWSNVLNKIDR